MSTCRIPVCVSKGLGDYGCVDCSPDDLTGQPKVTESTFKCPQCHRASNEPIQVSILTPMGNLKGKIFITR